MSVQSLLITFIDRLRARCWQVLQLQHQEYVLGPYLSALNNYRNCTLADSEVVAMVSM